MKKVLFVAIPLAILAVVVGVFFFINTQEAKENVNGNADNKEFSFVADKDFRVEGASNPGIRWASAGEIELLYRDPQKGTPYIVTSTDGLQFSNPVSISQEEADLFRAKQLPDGTWIGYDYDSNKGDTCLRSHTSVDGENYSYNTSCAYIFPSGDNGVIGVYDFFIDTKGNVVLLYTGDRQGPGNEDGLNNLRRAYSTDNGRTFQFTNDNVLSDEHLGGGGNSYVDPNLTVLDDGSIFLVAMRQGVIYGFISTNAGESFTKLAQPVMAPYDFSFLGNAKGMTDPQILRLKDGTYRVYAHLLLDEGNDGPTADDKEGIVSATSK